MNARWSYPALLLLVLAASASLFAADDGGTESVFTIGAGARAMGMGNGFTALAEDATAVYYNPAGLAFLPSQQISFLHTILFEGTVYDFASYVYPLGSAGGLGLAGMRIGTDDIERRDLTHDLGQFSASQIQILLSYGRALNDRLAAGGSLKLAHQSIDDFSAYGYGLDLAGRARVMSTLSAGFLMQDLIGARLKLAKAKERVPFLLRAGLAYLYRRDNLPLSGTVSLDLDKPENRSVKLHAGMEIAHSNGLVVRGGYDRDNITLGFGLRYQRLTFDYAYKFIDRLSDSHRFSLTFSFGATEAERRTSRAAAVKLSQQRAISDSRKESLESALAAADRYYAAGMLDSALAAYYRADAFAVDKSYINGRIAEIKQLQASVQAPSRIGVSPDSSMAQAAVDMESRARDLFAKGDLAAAGEFVAATRMIQPESPGLDSLDQAVQAAIGKSVWTNLAKAETAMGLGNYVAAYDSYSLVLALDPSNKQAQDGARRAQKSLDLAQRLNLALDYFNQGRFTSAQREFNSVLAIDSTNKTAAEYISRINSQIRESTSLEDLQRDSRVWQLYLNGLEAFRRGEYQKSIDYWEDVLEVYPNNANTIQNIEQARLRLQK